MKLTTGFSRTRRTVAFAADALVVALLASVPWAVLLFILMRVPDQTLSAGTDITVVVSFWMFELLAFTPVGWFLLAYLLGVGGVLCWAARRELIAFRTPGMALAGYPRT
jgi:hypothetical protein